MNKLANAMMARQMLAELSTISHRSNAYSVIGMDHEVVLKLPKTLHGMVASVAKASGVFNVEWIRLAIKEKLERDLNDVVIEGETDPAEGAELESPK